MYTAISSYHLFFADFKMSAAPSVVSPRPTICDIAPAAVCSELDRKKRKPAIKRTDIALKQVGDGRKHKRCKTRTPDSTGEFGVHQLTEDNLFELLVNRIRQREDEEVAAEFIRRQVQDENRKLKDENEAMRIELGKSNGLAKQNMAKADRAESQVEQWKIKIRKFRTLVNDLGHEYDALRNESDRLRDSVSCAERERDEAKKEIEQAKAQVTQAEQTIEHQQEQISNRMQSITALEDKLSFSEDRVNDLKDQLAGHKKQVATLEMYIQNYSMGHAKQLSGLQKEQSKLSENVDAGFKLLALKADDTNDSLATTTQLALEECRSSVQSLGEKFSSGQLDVQNFTNEANQIASQ